MKLDKLGLYIMTIRAQLAEVRSAITPVRAANHPIIAPHVLGKVGTKDRVDLA
jgi:hypothetical protein